jgi:hypothetical protein
MPTLRTNPQAPGRLFPPLTWDHGWLLSIQADRAGYRCSPKENLECLEDYETVEFKIDGPFKHLVDPATLDLPAEVLAKFSPLENGMPALGCNLTWEDVEEVRKAIIYASMNPNAGIPQGHIGWGGVRVYHGTSVEYAEDIAENGVDIARSHHGYFGQAFYVAEDRELAVSNYAEFSDSDGPGAVLEFEIAEGAKILDLRNAHDSEVYRASGLAEMIGRDDFALNARRKGIDGIYDRSVGGLAIYNPKVLGDVIKLFGNDPDNAEAPRF